MEEFKHLLSPIKIGRMELKNRYVVPPMATNLANKDGTVSQGMIDYWTARAKGGWGLLIVEFTAIDPLGKIGPGHPCLWDDKYIKGLKKLTDAVHAYDTRIAIQLSHVGRQTHEGIIGIPGVQPVSSSPIPCPAARSLPRELSTEEVYEIIEKFGDAAVRAVAADFDAVVVHGAHGYLMAEFMSSYSNKRTDEFGGALHNRMKFPLEIIRNMRRKIGASFPLTFRMSGEEKVPGGRTVEESRIVAHLVEKAGIDAIDVSVGVSGSAQYIFAPPSLPSGFLLPISQEIKKAVSVPVIAVGRINHPYMAEDAIRSGKADLIAVGRASFADPDIPNKVAGGNLDEILTCIGCLQGCIRTFPYPGKPIPEVGVTCLLNPFCGREGELIIKPARKCKRVVIVGGGPAGLEAAWVSAACGHQVTLYEKNPYLGGQFKLAAVPPFKQDIATAITYYIYRCKQHGVNIKTCTEATAKMIIDEKPDAVIIATGAEPILPDVSSIDNKRIITAWEILEGKKQAGTNVLIVGGGMVGCEMADFFGEHGHNVTIVEMLSEIALDVPLPVKYFLLERLCNYGVQVNTETKVVEFIDDGVIVTKGSKKSKLTGFDTIVLALGNRPVNRLKKQLEKKVPELYIIGDAIEPRKAIEAIEEGARTALKL